VGAAFFAVVAAAAESVAVVLLAYGCFCFQETIVVRSKLEAQ